MELVWKTYSKISYSKKQLMPEASRRLLSHPTPPRSPFQLSNNLITNAIQDNFRISQASKLAKQSFLPIPLPNGCLTGLVMHLSIAAIGHRHMRCCFRQSFLCSTGRPFHAPSWQSCIGSSWPLRPLLLPTFLQPKIGNFGLECWRAWEVSHAKPFWPCSQSLRFRHCAALQFDIAAQTRVEIFAQELLAAADRFDFRRFCGVPTSDKERSEAESTMTARLRPPRISAGDAAGLSKASDPSPYNFKTCSGVGTSSAGNARPFCDTGVAVTGNITAKLEAAGSAA